MVHCLGMMKVKDDGGCNCCMTGFHPPQLRPLDIMSEVFLLIDKRPGACRIETRDGTQMCE